MTGPTSDTADPGTAPVPFDVQNATPDAGDPIIEGIPDVGVSEAASQRAAAGSRAYHDNLVAVQPAQSHSAVSYTATAVEPSTTTDPHHDRGSAATGHVEDATPPDTAVAEASVEARQDPETPPREEPAPVEVAATADVAVLVDPHQADVAATTEADHAGG